MAIDKGLPSDLHGAKIQTPRGAITYGLVLGVSTAAISGQASAAGTTSYRHIGFDATMFPIDGSGKRPIAVMIKSTDILTYSSGDPDAPLTPAVGATHGEATIAVSDEYAMIPVNWQNTADGNRGFHAGWIKSAATANLVFTILWV